ncbi:MAG: RNA methyltransferase [Planctomycetota bacterium]|jgi:tRNA G18 (ribose-2'-O)-methylase SpoU
MRGYLGIGVYHPKTQHNIGTLWRHAYLYGAAFIFTIGHRYSKQCSDTQKTHRHIPLFQYEDLAAFINSRVYDCQIVAVELHQSSVSLPEFKHPKRAIYILGAEDHGLPTDVLSIAHQIVQIPTPKPQSMNVATAGSIVMYDRYVKAI